MSHKNILILLAVFLCAVSLALVSRAEVLSSAQTQAQTQAQSQAQTQAPAERTFKNLQDLKA